MESRTVAPTPSVAIGLTTIAARVETVSGTVASLLGQDYPSFTVNLYVSREPHLLDRGITGDLPRELQELQDGHRNFRVWFVPNIGSYRKLIPLLYQSLGHRRLLATADDDTIYPDHWLWGLVKHYQDHRCIVCYRGHFMARRDGHFLPYRQWMKNGIDRNPDLYVLPTGKDGVLYDTALLHPRVLDYDTALGIAPTADDLWFKLHSAAVDVPTFAIHADYRTFSLAGVEVGDSLYRRFNSAGENDETVRRLREYALGTLEFDFEQRWRGPGALVARAARAGSPDAATKSESTVRVPNGLPGSEQAVGVNRQQAEPETRIEELERQCVQLRHQQSEALKQAESVADSRSWRFGHGLFKLVRRLSFRSSRGTDGVKRVVETLQRPTD